ncbi:Uncharacterised protein [uncultured Comamonas sp.]|nr:Uncharacterised protein [uncultured Comamonas sp.]
MSPVHIPEKLPLPCQPRVVALLMNELRQEMPSLRRLNQLFGSDPVLAAWLLAQANAGVYQLSGVVQSIPQAVALLGVAQLRSLQKKAYGHIAQRVAGLEQLGAFSSACARLARSLAQALSLDGGLAYAAGLLHGLGYLVVQHTPVPAETRAGGALAPWDPLRPHWEEKNLGYTAAQAGAHLLQQWGLPAPLTRLIGELEHPLDMPEFDPLVAVLHLAVWVQRGHYAHWPEREMVRNFPIEVALAVGLDMDVVLQQEAPDWSQSVY